MCPAPLGGAFVGKVGVAERQRLSSLYCTHRHADRHEFRYRN